MFVIPCVFANSERHLLATELKQLLLLGGSKVAHFVEDVIGREQHFGLHGRDHTIAQQRRGVHHTLSSLRMSRRCDATNDGDTASFLRDVLQAFLITGDERWPLDQIARRISANRELGKKNEPGASGLSLTGKIDNLGGVTGKITDRSIDLPEGNLHNLSVEPIAKACQSAGREVIARSYCGTWV